MYTLRPYQKECANAIVKSIRTEPTTLVQLATGAGKTLIFLSLIKYWVQKFPNIRILMLAHLTDLITQTRQRYLELFPEGAEILGIMNAGSGLKKEHHKPVTFASIQTIGKVIDTIEPWDITVVDETHLLPEMESKSQFTKIIHTLFRHNKNHRLIGVTATPFRMQMGKVFGSEHHPDKTPWFKEMAFSLGLDELIRDNYLSTYRAFTVDKNIQKDLKTLSLTAGEYNQKELTGVMTKSYHIQSIVDAIKDKASDRKKILVFAVSIEHANMITKALQEEGWSAESLHSKKSKKVNDSIMVRFNEGDLRFVVSVMKLSIGMDSPIADCAILARPTKSAALFVQMAGRVLRKHHSKEDALLLDMAGNFAEFKSLEDPYVAIPKASKGTGGLIATKSCPQCDMVIHAASIKCKECEYEFPIQIVEVGEDLELIEITKGYVPAPQHFAIGHVMMVDYKSTAGNQMVKIVFDNAQKYGSPEAMTEFVSFGGEVSFLNHKGTKLWLDYAKTELPKTNAEAVERQHELINNLPSSMSIRKDGKYWRIHSYHVAPWVKQDYDGEKNNSILPIF